MFVSPTVSKQSKHVKYPGALNQYDAHTSDKTENITKKHPIPVILVIFHGSHTLFDIFLHCKIPAVSDSGQWPTKAQRFGRATGQVGGGRCFQGRLSKKRTFKNIQKHPVLVSNMC